MKKIGTAVNSLYQALRTGFVMFTDADERKQSKLKRKFWKITKQKIQD